MIWLFLILLFLIGIVVVTTEYVLEYADDFSGESVVRKIGIEYD